MHIIKASKEREWVQKNIWRNNFQNLMKTTSSQIQGALKTKQNKNIKSKHEKHKENYSKAYHNQIAENQ